MKNLFGWMLAALLALTVGVSCSDDDDLNEGAGIASPAWKAENQAVIEGETLDFEFTAESTNALMLPSTSPRISLA